MMQRVWTIPTILSFSRILLVGPIVYCLLGESQNNRWWAVSIIVVAIITDLLDGYLARQLHQVSDFGKIIDPLADKIAVGAVTFVLVWLERLPLWFLLLVLVRDVLILAGGLHIRRTKHIVVQSNLPGKLAVILVSFLLLLTIVEVEFLETARMLALWLSVLMMLFSFGVYAQRLLIGRNIVNAGEHGTS